MIVIIGVLFTVAMSSGVVYGNVHHAHPRPRVIWVASPSLRLGGDLPLTLAKETCAEWEAMRDQGAPFGACVYGGVPWGQPGEVYVTLLERARYPDSLGHTELVADPHTRMALSAVLELRADVKSRVIAHELLCHVLGYPHASRSADVRHGSENAMTDPEI